MEEIIAKLSEKLGFKINKPDYTISSVGGGCISQTNRLTLKNIGKSFFIKTNSPTMVNMFEAEFFGLQEIINSQTIKAPEAILFGTTKKQSFIILENINFGYSNSNSQKKLGENLAKMHRHLAKDGKFGWHMNNTIGSTPQINQKCQNWIDFFGKHRLAYQFALAEQNGLKIAQKDNLLKNLPNFFANYQPQPSLLHGDLWGGNYSFDTSGEPVIYDPAVYFGDRETDIAFTEMFGGFSSTFYNSYNNEWALDKGYSNRKKLYNLYHVLNHYNIFGGSYGSQAQHIVKELTKL